MRLLKIENSAVLAPIPSASVPIMTARSPHSCATREPRPDILPHAVEHAQRPDLACVLDGERDVAHGLPARLRGLVGPEAVALERGLTQRAVRLDLLTEIGVVTRPTK